MDPQGWKAPATSATPSVEVGALHGTIAPSRFKTLQRTWTWKTSLLCLTSLGFWSCRRKTSHQTLPSLNPFNKYSVLTPSSIGKTFDSTTQLAAIEASDESHPEIWCLIQGCNAKDVLTPTNLRCVVHKIVPSAALYFGNTLRAG